MVKVKKTARKRVRAKKAPQKARVNITDFGRADGLSLQFLDRLPLLAPPVL